MVIGGIVLCGGRSARMGTPKWALPLGNEQMLQRVVRLLAEAARPIVVVAAPSQQLPALAGDVMIAHDQCEGLGPLEGLRAGLAAISPYAPAAFATGCDVPLLVPAFVQRMAELLVEGHWEIAVPFDGQRYHPLAAAYRTSVISRIQPLLDSGERRIGALLAHCRTRAVPTAELRSADPPLATLENINRPEDYWAALATAGFRAAPADSPARR